MVDFFKEATELFDLMVEIRRHIHQYPELDRNLKNTVDYIEKHLIINKISYRRIGDKGLIAEIGSSKEKIVALRADMDALPIQDLKQVSYKSKNSGVMHACGHDAHTAILLAAGIILKKHEHELYGTVRLIFQPAEETDGGALDMIENGCLDGISAILGLHVDCRNEVGTVSIKKGTVTASSNLFKITVYGEGAHGAAPHEGIDPILISARIIESLQTIVSREISPLKNAVVSVCKINGGTAENIICDKITMEGTVRAVGEDLKVFCKNRISEIAEKTAEAFRGSAKIDFIEGYPSYDNDLSLYSFFQEITKNLDWVKIKYLESPSMGVEDFAYYAKLVPGFFYDIGCINKEKGIVHPNHGSYFDIDENCMKIGCALQCMMAYEILKNET